MKLNFIFNIVARPQAVEVRAALGSAGLWPAVPRASRPRSRRERRATNLSLALVCIFIISSCFPAIAQQPVPATPSDSTPQSPAADPPDPPPDVSTQTMFPHFKNSRFWLSGQANFIFQTHPPFPAPYSGVHSLSPNYEKATSRVLTLYTGVRIDNSTEILVDLEEAGGAALTQGLDRKSTRLNSSHALLSRMPSSA